MMGIPAISTHRCHAVYDEESMNWPKPSFRRHDYNPILHCNMRRPIRYRRTAEVLMHDDLPRGGLIRKMWAAHAGLYRDHLLRLDQASRRSRFAGAVSEQFLRDYADLAFGIDTIIHGFFVD